MGEQHADLVRDGGGASRTGSRQDGRERVGAETAHETGRRQIVVDHSRESDEEPVAGVAAVSGIDAVEAVEVQHQKRRFVAIRQRSPEERRPGALEGSTIADSGEPVVELCLTRRRFGAFEGLRPRSEAAAAEPPRRGAAGGHQQQRRDDHQREGIEEHSRDESEARPSRIMEGRG